MKKRIAFAVLVFCCIAFTASAQEFKYPTVQFGMDFGVMPGGFSIGYNYQNNDPIEKSGTYYRGGFALGGTVQVGEGPGWNTEARFRRGSIANPLFWFQEAGAPTYYNDGSSSNAVNQHDGHFTAFDVVQQIPVRWRAAGRHGFSVGALVGLTNVRAEIHNITDILQPPTSHDDATIVHIFWGPKGGGRASYTFRRVDLATEFSVGYLHAHGRYKDLQSEDTSGGLAPLPPYVIDGTTWAWERNWRSTATVRVTSHLGLTLTNEIRVITIPYGEYIFKPPGPDLQGTSQFIRSQALMVGFVFRL